jgi:hypothetical protein
VVYAIELVVFPKAIPMTVFESTSVLSGGGEVGADMTNNELVGMFKRNSEDYR